QVAGPATAALVEAAAGAELLVLGSRGLGPVTHAVIRRVGCPVAIVPHH
ncbi:universal stress protein, partial [Streptomyces sp. NPDC055186]